MEHISITGSFRIRDGSLDDFRLLVTEIADDSRANLPGTLVYEWFLSDDGTSARIYERFRDADAMDAHEAVFGERYAERLMALVEPVEIAVLGAATDAHREAMSGFAAFAPLCAGFAR